MHVFITFEQPGAVLPEAGPAWAGLDDGGGAGDVPLGGPVDDYRPKLADPLDVADKPVRLLDRSNTPQYLIFMFFTI